MAAVPSQSGCNLPLQGDLSTCSRIRVQPSHSLGWRHLTRFPKGLFRAKIIQTPILLCSALKHLYTSTRLFHLDFILHSHPPKWSKIHQHSTMKLESQAFNRQALTRSIRDDPSQISQPPSRKTITVQKTDHDVILSKHNTPRTMLQ